MKHLLLIITLILTSLSLHAQTDFPAMKQEFLDYRRADNQDSALFIARKMNQLALKEHGDTSYFYALSQYCLGKVNETIGDKENMLESWYNASSALKKQNKIDTLHGYVLRELAWHYHNIGVKDSILKYYKLRIEVGEKLFQQSINNADYYVKSLRRYASEILDLNSDFEQAEYYFKKSAAIAEEFLRGSLTHLDSYNYLGYFYGVKKDDYIKGDSILKKTLDEFENNNSLYYDLEWTYRLLGIIYRRNGLFIQSLSNYLEAYQRTKRAILIPSTGLSEYTLGNITAGLGDAFLELRELDSAKFYYRKSEEIRKKLFDNQEISWAWYGHCFGNFGKLSFVQNKFNEAFSYYKEWSESQENDSYYYIQAILKMISCSIELAEYTLAKELLVDIENNVYFDVNPIKKSEFESLYGKMYSKKGDLQNAKTHYTRAYEIRNKYLQPNHPDLAKSVNRMGVIYFKMGQFKEVIKYFKQSLKIRLKNNQKDEISSAYNNMGVLFETIGDYTQSMDSYNKSLEYLSQLKRPVDRARLTTNLGSLHLKMGHYQECQKYTNEAIEIRKNNLPKNHPSLYEDYIVLGQLNEVLGDNENALKNYLQAKEIISESKGTKNTQYIEVLISIASARMSDNQLIKAKSNLLEALELSSSFQENNFLKSSIISELANYYILSKNYPDAISNLMKSNQEFELINNGVNPYLMSGLKKLSKISLKQNKYPEAIEQIQKAIAIAQKMSLMTSPEYIELKTQLAIANTNKQNFDSANEIFNEIFTKKSKQIADNFEWLSENQKEVYWKQESGFYDKLSWFANKANTKVPEAVTLNYNGALITKSKLLETKINRENYDLKRDELRDELKYRKKLLIKLESDGSDKRELMDKLRHEADSLDKQLELSWPAYAEQKRNLLITWDKVHQNLSAGEAAIEFVRFREDEDSAYQYQALIIRKDLELPVLAPLCMEEALLDIEPNSGFSAYYPLVWEPMEAHLKDIHTIYYAPSGELYNVPFHAIYGPKGSGDQEIAAKRNKRGEILTDPETESEEDAEFLMDRYKLHQLTSTRYLALGLKKKEKEKPETSIAMVGGVNYDYLPGDENNKAKKSKKSKKSKNRSSASASGKLAYLEGTKKETEAIHTTVETKSWEPTYLEGNNAKEENITKFTDKQAKGILHIATHGYAFPEYSSLDTTIKENSLRYSYRFSQNPMVRSGLILAGGNWAWTGSDTLDRLGAEENGILTALEVSSLNLRKTKLVVLSACETGLGKIEGSEGTFGLKRGFKLAGVEQMIVSLWSVPDKETMELMTLFYEDLTQSLNPVISFEKAQNQMRETYPTRPDLWAGFVLVR